VAQPEVEFARTLLTRHRTIDRPATFTLLGREWDVLPGVFSPSFTGASGLFASWVPYPVGGSFLEIGCGTGLIAVSGALAGCASVTATDISPRAVDNTVRNARRHGVADRVRVVVSDLFDDLCGERYDVIFWNSNFIEVPADFVCAGPLEKAMFDPGYAAHRRYLADGRRHLRPDGRLLLGFSSMGNRRRLEGHAHALGLRAGVVTSEVRHVPARVEYSLLEFGAG
jgi:release factor glutamine methyltransferase